jgi:hypothetical protein
VSNVVGSCGATTPGTAVEVRQSGCDLIFPGPSVEGTARPRPDGNGSSENLRIGTGTHSCLLAAFPEDGLLQIGCGSICNLVLGRGDGG